MVGDGLDGIVLRTPGHIHEERNRILHRLQVADIENPHALDAEVVGQRQLFKHLLRLGDVEPLCISGSTHIVDMVVDTPATLTFAFGSSGHTTDITPVVVADKDHHIIRHTETGIIIVLHLFIERPYLRGLLSRFARHFLDNPALVVNDIFQQLGVGIRTHGLVAITTHTDSHDVVGTLHALDTLTEETVEVFFVRLVVPRTPILTMTGIFLMIAGHRLVVGGTHDNTHLVGDF